jgi:hypothetical protein
MNGLRHCHDAAATCMHPTAPVCCTELQHEDDGGFLGSTPIGSLA